MPVDSDKLDQLFKAIKDKHDVTLKRLLVEEKILEAGWDPSVRISPLAIAAEVGNKFAIQLLVKHFNLDIRSHTLTKHISYYPIEIAAEQGHWDCVEEMARLTAINIRLTARCLKNNNIYADYLNSLGCLLHQAISKGLISTIQALLNAEAPINHLHPDHQGTYLHSAVTQLKDQALSDHLVKKMIIIFLMRGVDFFVRNNNRVFAYSLACGLDKENLFKECMAVYLKQADLFFVMIQSRRHSNVWPFNLSNDILFRIFSLLYDVHPIIMPQFLMRQENVLTKISVNCFSRSFGLLFNRHSSDSRKLLTNFNQHIDDNIDMTNQVKQAAHLFANEQKEQNKVVENLNKYHLLPRPGK